MICERLCMYVLFAAVIAHAACGVPGAGELTVSGTVVLSGAGEVRGPVFVAVTTSNDYDAIEDDPVTNVLGVVRTEDNGSFTADLGEMGVVEGEAVHLIAFADNDYSGGVPYPTSGDVLGFYFDRERWSTAVTAVSAGVQGVVIPVNRPVSSFTARVSGTVTGGGGDLIIIAYRGALDSMNPDDIDVDNIIGYRVIRDASGSAPYSLRIFPFGAAPPLDEVYIIVLNDRNRNGIPDGGDRV
ncbi:MAG TPA: hypothetical protein PLT75_09665, partial [Spirochaetota bacterium]|nr:hypothetical protein [Spirochaetota bacterium]